MDVMSKFLILMMNFLCSSATSRGLLNPEVRAEILECWKCQNSVGCVEFNKTVIEREICDLHQPYCVVKSLTEKNEIKTIERHCAAECESGCVRVANVQHCIQCCVRPLCNIGTSGSQVLNMSPYYITQVFASFFLVLLNTLMAHGLI